MPTSTAMPPPEDSTPNGSAPLPAGLLGAALVFWGWQIGYVWPGVLAAAVLEGARWLPRRFDLRGSDFSRIADLCTVLLIVLALVVVLGRRSTAGVFVIFRWLPMVLLPIVAAQYYSTTGTIDVSALFLLARRRRKKGDEKENRPGPPDPPAASKWRMNIAWPYLVLVVLQSGAGNRRDVGFFAGVLLLTAWSLWRRRSRRYGTPVFVGLLLLAAGIGHLGHQGLYGLQEVVERMGVEWFSTTRGADSDPFRRQTAIGSMGSLKLAHGVLFRVEADELAVPILLGEAAFQAYRGRTWFAVGTRFADVPTGPGHGQWRLHPTSGGQRMTIWQPLAGGRGLLKLPPGAGRIDGLPARRLQRHPTGAVKVDGGPDLARYQVEFQPPIHRAAPPDTNDLRVPADILAALESVGRRLGLAGMPPDRAVQAAVRFFHEQFEYSLGTAGEEGLKPSLSDFLLRSRRGHCEYFATAVALLLRSAGIPARYVSGFVVEEYSQLENRYIVRSRHAHAWARAWVGGGWLDVDATPPDWSEFESRQSSWLQPVWDRLAYLYFEFQRWRTDSAISSRHLLAGLLLPLGWILWRRLRRIGGTRPLRTPVVRAAAAAKPPPRPSLLGPLEQRLADQGYPRRPSEPPRAWIERVARIHADPQHIRDLAPVMRRYYRYRYDPDGGSAGESTQITAQLARWLDTRA